MTARALALVLAGAAALAVVVVLLVSSIGSDTPGHTMSDGSRMDGVTMPAETMPGSMAGMGH